MIPAILFAGDLLLKPIVASAGKDISHWFDNKTGDVSMLAAPSDPARFSSAYDAPGICDLEILIVGSKPVQQTVSQTSFRLIGGLAKVIRVLRLFEPKPDCFGFILSWKNEPWCLSVSSASKTHFY